MTVLDDNYDLSPNEYVEFKTIHSPIANSNDDIQLVAFMCVLANLRNGFLVKQVIGRYLDEISSGDYVANIDMDLSVVKIPDYMVNYEKDSLCVV